MTNKERSLLLFRSRQPLWSKLMAIFSVNAHRFDPYRDFKFNVVLDGKVIPGVTRVSPLIRRTEAVENWTGTAPSHPRVMPGQSHFEPIEIERGAGARPHL